MLKGTIVAYEKASNENGLVINGELRSQKNVTLKQSCIDKFNLKVGDVVLYDGMPYETVTVFEVVKNS